MILAVDIGNTNVVFAVIGPRKVIRKWTVETSLCQIEFVRKVRRTCRQAKRYAVTQAVICSVVPRKTESIKAAIKKELKIDARIIGRHIKIPMKNRYRYPKRVGRDRLVCAYAAGQIYGVPAIIVDFGTAITFDAISKSGSYLGGVIIPGLRLSAESLFFKTALLPNIKIEAPKELIGRDTKESILSGLFYGYGSMSDGLIRMISKKLGRPQVILTGGHIRLIKKYLSISCRIDEDLIFKGLRLLLNEKK